MVCALGPGSDILYLRARFVEPACLRARFVEPVKPQLRNKLTELRPF